MYHLTLCSQLKQFIFILVKHIVFQFMFKLLHIYLLLQIKYKTNIIHIKHLYPVLW